MLSVDYVHRFISSLTFTVIVESLVIFLLLWFVFKKRDSGKAKIFIAGFFASFMTIPYVWFVFRYIHTWNYQTSLNYSEPFVFAIEVIFYRLFLKLDWKIAFTISLLANLASYLLGPLLRSHGLWIYW